MLVRIVLHTLLFQVMYDHGKRFLHENSYNNDPQGFELSTAGLYRGLIVGHHAVRHKELQGIPELKINGRRKKWGLNRRMEKSS